MNDIIYYDCRVINSQTHSTVDFYPRYNLKHIILLVTFKIQPIHCLYRLVHTNRNRVSCIFSNRSNNSSKNCDQQENWAPPDQPVQQRRRSHYVVEVSRRCSTSSDVPNRSQQQQPHCKQHNFTNRASQRSSSQGKHGIGTFISYITTCIYAPYNLIHMY